MTNFKQWNAALKKAIKQTKSANLSLSSAETFNVAWHNMQVEGYYFLPVDVEFEKADLIDLNYALREYGRTNKTR